MALLHLAHRIIPGEAGDAGGAEFFQGIIIVCGPDGFRRVDYDRTIFPGMFLLHHAAAKRKCKIEPFKPNRRKALSLKEGSVKSLVGTSEKFSLIPILLPILRRA